MSLTFKFVPTGLILQLNLLLKNICHCSTAVETVLKSLDDPRTAGLILEEQANALKSILGDASVLKLVRVRSLFIYLFIYLLG